MDAFVRQFSYILSIHCISSAVNWSFIRIQSVFSLSSTLFVSCLPKIIYTFYSLFRHILCCITKINTMFKHFAISEKADEQWKQVTNFMHGKITSVWPIITLYYNSFIIFNVETSIKKSNTSNCLWPAYL